ncbi:hypothetical protein K2173_020645 [Erythroxylum novogranatense]|uniref:Phytocyanin domain-containing protein n=1 Tax=Erythroxylum novogranatense TaxID=1862640 RepID=A0AAV8TNA2_9ROSI|nr:hypothetical protein K2173_020645 [Erythroxylum novogranatense]
MAGELKMAFLAVIATASLLRSSVAQTSHVVGGSSGWTIPSSGSGSYSSWAANQGFSVGDTLVFNFANGIHDVAQVTRSDYDGCSTINPIFLETTSPAGITLNATGEHYFICNFTGHCSAGQKLMINVSAASSSPSPAPQRSPSPDSSSSPAPAPATTPSSSPAPAPEPEPATTPSSSPASAPEPEPATTPSSSPAPSPAPSRSSVTYTVLDSLGWNIPSNGAAAYQTWVANKNFMIGDVLVFNYANGVHNVAEVTKEAYNSCNTTNPISLSSTPPTRMTLTTSGEHFYICAVPRHCSLGQLLAINVSGGTANTPPSSSETPPSSTTPSPTPPPPGNSAPALGVTSLIATIFTIFVALLY